MQGRRELGEAEGADEPFGPPNAGVGAGPGPRAGVVACCGVLAACWLVWQWRERTKPTPTPPNVIASENIGDQIVTVLERHRTAAGRYPATLPELVPAELARVVPPLEGSGKWDCRASAAGDRFDPSFHGTASFDTYLYDSAARRWTAIEPGNW